MKVVRSKARCEMVVGDRLMGAVRLAESEKQV